MYRRGTLLVTGGAGVIGRAVARKLLSEGYQIRIIDTLRQDSTAAIASDLPDSAEYIVGSACDRELVSNAIKGCSGVVHLAAAPSFLSYEVDRLGVYQEAALSEGCERYIYASSSAVYEGNEVPYREDLILRPPDLKATTKLSSELLARVYSRRYGLATIGLRPFSVYAPDERSKGGFANIISLFAWAMVADQRPIVWGDGLQTRDFVFVDDVGEAVLKALRVDLGDRINRLYNVGTGTESTFLKVIEEINFALNERLEPVFIDVPVGVYAGRLLADPSLAQRELGFEAKHKLADGIGKVVEAVKRLPRQEIARLAGLQHLGLEIATNLQSTTITAAGP